jgi:exonuclease SbcD
MKLFHTADWHLGKLVQGVSMIEDQRHVLRQFVDDVEQERPDAVIIAGDLYDRAVPPTEAVQLLDEVLETIVLRLRIPVLAIAGNHDSPGRLDFASGIMKAAGLHMAGELRVPFERVTLRDEHGDVHVHLIPYAEPSIVRHVLQDDTIRTHDDAMRAITERIRESIDPASRHVIVAHAYVTPGGEPGEYRIGSERPLAIGGAEYVRAEYFAGFTYAALGHLHKAHPVGTETIRYAGSPLKYSIAEEDHHKGYWIVHIDGRGEVRTEHRALKPARDLRRVAGRMEELERHPVCEDYVFVELTDPYPVLYPMERIRSVYPNALHVSQPHVMAWLAGGSANGESAGGSGARLGRAGMDELSLFRSFFEEVCGETVPDELEQLFVEAVQELRLKEGERDASVETDDDRLRAV